jgi:hypothetical protein
VPIPFVLLLSLLFEISIYFIIRKNNNKKFVFVKIFKPFVQGSKYGLHKILIVVCIQM